MPQTDCGEQDPRRDCEDRHDDESERDQRSRAEELIDLLSLLRVKS